MRLLHKSVIAIKSLLSLVLFVAPGLGHSQTLTQYTITDGNSLASFCKEVPKPTSIGNFNFGMCIGYISGIVGAEQVSQMAFQVENIPDTRDLKFCTDERATIGQLVAIVEKYLSNHPEKLHTSAALIVQTALTIAFPCRTSKTSSE